MHPELRKILDTNQILIRQKELNGDIVFDLANSKIARAEEIIPKIESVDDNKPTVTVDLDVEEEFLKDGEI